MKSLLIVLILVLNNTFSFDQKQRDFRMCFDIGSSNLRGADESQIQEITQLLQNPNFTYIKIFGYATKSGDEVSNTELSKRRALEVYDRIKALHVIDESKIYITWLGESEDVYDLHYDKAQPRTPCVEVIVQYNE